ncbi:MAG: T9SS type A sorting domain-containing protein [Paludibacter sp.]|nr:T9SS type A sorting domain-containing protein [Paludibacter sp.]
MKLKQFGLIIALILSTIYAFSGTPVASIVFSSPVVSTNLTHYTTTSTTSESYTIQTTKNGVACRQISLSKYGYFNVNDIAIPSTQNNLIFNITFFDEGSNKINLQYNANDGNRYKALSLPQSGSNAWVTAKVTITNAALNNLQNNTSDFRISGIGGDVFIKEITIEIGTLNPEGEPIPVAAASTYSEFTGKSVAGYQAWFVAGTPTSGWTHWNYKTNGAPGKGTMSFEVCPDISEYPDDVLKPTNFAPMGNGNPLKLFSSSSQSVIDVHFKWMKDYGIDGAAVQRFIGNIGSAIINSPSSTISKIKQAAQTNERIFYICYDTSSSGMDATWDEVIKMDWVYNVEQNNNLTTSPAYAKVGNKPVVQLWGLGFKGGKNPGTAAETIALIEFFKARGCYVIGGTPRGWRTGTSDSKGVTQSSTVPGDNEDFLPVYHALNMISPWMPGRIKNNTDADNLLASTMTPDKTYCDGRNIQYMPVNFPGFAWSQWKDGDVNWAPRNAGEFMWRQATNIKKLGVQNMYFAMFDEYDEGTAIMKNATDWSMIPTDQYFLTSSADGLWLSSDFQLRVAGAAVEMLKGNRAVTTNVPVAHSNGPVYYRNSFEKRTTAYNYVDDVATKNGTFNIDPCFYQNSEILRNNVLSPVCEIQTTNTKSGLYSVKTSGTISLNTSAKYIYKIATTKIAVKPDMKLSFWKKTENDLGRHVTVDFITKSSKRLTDLGYVDQNGASMHPATPRGTVGGNWEQFTCKFGSGTLLGDTIVGIEIVYNQTGPGTFTAYFDDFQIDELPDVTSVSFPESGEGKMIAFPGMSNGKYRLTMPESANYSLYVYNMEGKIILNEKFNGSEAGFDISSCSNGVYILKIVTADKKYMQKLVKL